MLTKSDIYEGEDNAAASKKTTKSIKQADNDVENQCDATVASSDIESRDIIDSEVNMNDIDAQATPAVIEKRSDSEDSDDELPAFEFDNDQMVCIPLPGQVVKTEPTGSTHSSRRLVSNGCAICLSLFEEGDKITWSSNPDCCHVYHSDCALSWYLAVGKKAQKRRKRDNPTMTDEEALDLICKFSILCPCCRQEFCTEIISPSEKKDEETGDGDGDGDGGDISTDNN